MKTKHFNRNKVLDRRFTKKSGRKNRHHIKAKSLGGSMDVWNLLILDEERHRALHFLFGNMNLLEIIELLQRLLHAKESQRLREQCK